MVTGEDYNTFPYANFNTISKVKAVNRISSGTSRFLDVIDNTGSMEQAFQTVIPEYIKAFVDEKGLSGEEKSRVLQGWGSQALADIAKGKSEEKIGRALVHTVNTFNIPLSYFESFLHSMEILKLSDIQKLMTMFQHIKQLVLKDLE
mgnify:CR=1 FL=1